MEWMEAADEAMLHLSVLTVGEIRKGVAGLASGKRRTQLEAWIEVDLQARFAGSIVAIDTAIADHWGWIASQAKRNGKTLPIIDGLLAATALHHNLTIVSRNVSDFTATLVRVLNPWDG